MPKIEYKHHKFNAATLDTIARAEAIIIEYARQGFSLTLRQLYYQFVARDLIANTMKEYKRLGSIVNNARMAGLIDWNSIEDRTRNLKSLPKWADPAEVVSACADQFRVDMWEGQTHRPEVWIEKDALTGVIEKVCNRWGVPYFACRGYSSQSETWRAGVRLGRYIDDDGQAPLILHLGDHDPSGIDMTRDIIDRLDTFTDGREPKVIRLALNMDQVDQYDPPPNPAKLSDSRAAGYIQNYGRDSWELDALAPPVIEALIEDTLTGYVDADLWSEREALRDEGRRLLRVVADDWDDITEDL